jgi:glutathione S-transferase
MINFEKPILYIGPRNYSSWSMRPWLAMKWSGIDFSEKLIDLDQEGYGKCQIKEVLEISPTGTVPALKHGELLVWDSLAICEYIEEIAPNELWPMDGAQRAIARAITCEMHSGFANMRNDLTHNIRRIIPTPPIKPDTMREIQRLDFIFSSQLDKFGGPFLFGAKPTIADAFYTPMAVRCRTYSLPLSEKAAIMRDNLLNSEEFLLWSELAQKEWKPFKSAPHDSVYE